MKRFLVLFLLLPLVAGAMMGERRTISTFVTGYTDADSTRDIKQYIAITRGADAPCAIKAQIVVQDGDEMVGNEDSCRIYLFRDFGGAITLFDSSKSATLPCTLYVAKPCYDNDGGSLGDTLWGGNIGFYVNIDSDTTDDTAFYSRYPIQIEAVLK